MTYERQTIAQVFDDLEFACADDDGVVNPRIHVAISTAQNSCEAALDAAEREIDRLRRESSPDWMRAERDQAVAESERLRKEIERLRAQVESVGEFSVKLLGATLCGRHGEEASKMAFSAFAEKTAKAKCHWCANSEVERLRAEVEAMRAALQPMARAYQRLSRSPLIGESYRIWSNTAAYPDDGIFITVGDCKRAHELSATPRAEECPPAAVAHLQELTETP